LACRPLLPSAAFCNHLPLKFRQVRGRLVIRYSWPLEEAMATYALTDKAVLLRAEDDVAVAKAELAAGTVLEDGTTRIEVRQDIRPGHKVARKAVRTGAPVRRYGQVIGFATQDIAVGDHVHQQHLGIGDLSAARYDIGEDAGP